MNTSNCSTPYSWVFTYHGDDELPDGTFRGDDELPDGTFRGDDELPVVAIRGKKIIHSNLVSI